MKFFVSLLVCSSLAPAADFYTGQAARLIIGQRHFTSQFPEPDSQDNPANRLLGAVGGLAIGGNRIVIADSNRVAASPINNRVLILNNLSGVIPEVTAELAYDQRCPACVGTIDTVIGQPDLTTTALKLVPTQASLRTPTGVATDGIRLAVADTDNNRVLIWNTIPAANNTPASIVLGQAGFTTSAVLKVPTAKSMRGPQGVWIQGNRLFVADTQNHRVLIWNSFPTTSGQPADVVVGQPDFTTFIEPDITKATSEATATNLLNPVSATSDGTRMYVADLGHNRVVIWNSIPATNNQPANVALGQKDLTSAAANDATNLCDSNGMDTDNKPTYPARCQSTMDFPRFALSDGKRVFVSDGGNDRVLVWNTIPAQNGQRADVILGQPDGIVNRNSDVAAPNDISSVDTMRTPMALAFDGTNLFAADPFNRRVMIFSLADQPLKYTSVRNAASFDVFATANITFTGQIKADDQITLTIAGVDYVYKIVKDDTFEKIIRAFIKLINDTPLADQKVIALSNLALNQLLLTAKVSGVEGNSIEFSTKLSDSAVIVVTTSGAKLDGGQDAAKIAPGTIVSIVGADLSEVTEATAADAKTLPDQLGGVQVYFDGIRSPVVSVSPTQINAQIPFELYDTTSVSAFVRIKKKDGRIAVTAPTGVPIIAQNPGIFADPGTDPRPGVVLHYSSFATGTVSVDGSVNASDVATVTVDGTDYSYTVLKDDTLTIIRDALADVINADPDAKVVAFKSGSFTRLRLRSKIPGPDGNGLPFTASASSGAQVIMTATNSVLCCSNVAGSRVTVENPALPGETIVVLATGLGLVGPDDARRGAKTGEAYDGPDLSEPNSFVSSLAAGKTANVLQAGLKKGAIGIYEVHLELNSDLPTNPLTQLTIAQDIYVSNIITFAVYNPADQTPQ